MKKIESILIMIFLLFTGYEILTESESILNSVSFSLNIFKNNVFPSLFPFFVLSNLLVNYGLVEFMSNIFKGFMNKFFKINSRCAFIFFMSIISGNPANAKYTRELYLNGDIDRFEAIKVLSFSSFASPLFILGTVSVFLNNYEAALLVLICHYVGNFIVGLLLRNYHPSNLEDKASFKKAINEMHRKRISNKDSFGVIITNSLIQSINTLLLILGVITVCLVLTTIINNIFSINDVYRSALNGFIEMTQGLKYIGMEDIPLRLKSTLTVMIISFGGLSVHMQIMSILNDTDIKYLPFLCMRLLASLISSFLLFISFNYWINL
ncbi:MAG: hypothetical protein IKJ43_01585 [Bacilli bacterium]|nr:hypothetical protein [Bacilli bacterium]